MSMNQPDPRYSAQLSCYSIYRTFSDFLPLSLYHIHCHYLATPSIFNPYCYSFFHQNSVPSHGALFPFTIFITDKSCHISLSFKCILNYCALFCIACMCCNCVAMCWVCVCMFVSCGEHTCRPSLLCTHTSFDKIDNLMYCTRYHTYFIHKVST